MCQYSNNCKNFIPSKTNNTNCIILCTRNPQLDYELPNNFVPIRALSREEVNLDIEVSPIKIIREGENFDETSIKDMIQKVKDDKKIPEGVKRDRVQDILIKRGIIQSTSGEFLDTTNLPETRNEPLAEALKDTGKRAKEQEEVAEVVKDNIRESQDVKGWKAPRRRGKGDH